MARKQLSLLATAGIMSLAGGLTSAASALEIISNGGFETGNFTGWSIAENGTTGALSVETSSITPNSGLATVGSASGNYYALSDSLLGEYALIQSFAVAPSLSATLSFSLFVNDQNGLSPVIDPSGLDHTTGGSFDPNQHVRVDILSASATPFATGNDVLQSLYLGGATGPASVNPYRSFSFDLTNLLDIGGTYQLRFAGVSNQDFLNAGIDSVSLQVSSVPEPENFALLLIGLSALSWSLKRNQRHSR